ncbi:MAG: XkdX family protein [Oscillospiraceae bacterium]
MFEFIKLQYILGKITKAQVQGFVPKFITAEQAVEIISYKEI